MFYNLRKSILIIYRSNKHNEGDNVSCRFIYLAFENLKRSFFKIRFLITIIGLTFIIAYSGAFFSIYGGSFECTYNANDYIIYFLNDFTIIGIFLPVLFIIFISSIFAEGEVNYMYISRLKRKSDIYKSYILSIFLLSVVFLLLTMTGVFILSLALGEFNNNWSEFAAVVIKDKGYGVLSEVYSPVTSIVISIWLLFILLNITGLIFYLGYSISLEIGLPILINSIIFIISGVSHNFEINMIYKALPGFNTILLYHDVKTIYPSLEFSFIYIIVLILTLMLTSYSITRIKFKF